MDHALRVGSGEDVEDVVGDREDLVVVNGPPS